MSTLHPAGNLIETQWNSQVTSTLLTAYGNPAILPVPHSEVRFG
jgi:hypothetical protein